VLPLAPAPQLRLPTARSLAPSLGALAAAVALAAAGAGAYVVARSTPLFALREVDVRGVSPTIAGEVRHALAPVVGRSLVGLDGRDVLARVRALPRVRSAGYDRAFPHTLVVRVRVENPTAVIRSGRRSWLVSDRGRVLAAIGRTSAAGLPLVWMPAATRLTVGGRVRAAVALRSIHAAAVARREGFHPHVSAVRYVGGELTFSLAGRRELRLGDAASLPLKLAIAGRILASLAPVARGGPTYLDVSFPRKSVAGGTLKSEVEIEG